jgi:hypothetical protein
MENSAFLVAKNYGFLFTENCGVLFTDYSFFNNYGSGPCPDEGGILSHPARAGLYCTIRYLYKQQKKPQNLI